ncbi:MAG: hypothetical protein KF773_42025 [Deltaproteobacteria bacterium]|nr:hypothetical protein [Deltaproteobacteria bacterium]MCW5808901.1 hypothetical protein [Deltaproteobacteria bacterium]
MRAYLLVLLMASPALAQPKPAPAKGGAKSLPAPVVRDPRMRGPDGREPGPHREGEYGGVTPGQSNTLPSGRPRIKPARGTLGWIGFEARDGGAQVFFQAAGPFKVTQKMEGSTLVVHLDLVRLGQNTWRQIDTRFFDNPLSGMVARYNNGIDVRISFKNPKDAREGTLTQKVEVDGMAYAYLTFPEGADGNRSTIKDKGEIEK